MNGWRSAMERCRAGQASPRVGRSHEKDSGEYQRRCSELHSLANRSFFQARGGGSARSDRQ